MDAQVIARPPGQPLVGTQSAAGAVARVTYTHDAMIDMILANPMISQNQLAATFGFSVGWVSRVKNSDAFLARLAQRKDQLVDPMLAATIDENLRAVANRSLEVVVEKLSMPLVDGQFALDAAAMATKALGYGARQNNVSLQQNFVVAMPQKAENAQVWANKYNGTSPALRAMVAEATGDRAAEQVVDATIIVKEET